MLGSEQLSTSRMQNCCLMLIRCSGCCRNPRRYGNNLRISAGMLCVWLAAVPLSGGLQRPPIQYDLRVGSSVGEPVLLEVTIANEGSGVLLVDLGLSNRTRFVFEVKSPDGRVSRTRPMPADGFQPGGRFRLAAGESESVTIPLSELMNFNQEGSYVVSLTYDGAVTGQDATIQVQRQARWEFTLGSRDVAALRRRCEELLDIILSPLRSKEHTNAVAALVSIRDEAAVPYLLRSAEARVLATDEVAALERIGGPEARSALEKLARSANRWTAASAKGALSRIK